MNEQNVKTIVKHCCHYPSSNCYGYILETGKAVPVAHTPFLPPFTTIIYEEISSKKQIKGMYFSNTDDTIPQSIFTFCSKYDIAEIYHVNLYNENHKFEKYTLSSSQWSKPEEINIKVGKIDGKNDIVEFESIYEQSL